MDSVTQAVLGASIGGALLGKHLGRGALLAGAVLGTLPDLDVLIDYGNVIDNYSLHRGFSHSLLVLIPLATLLAVGLQRWKPQVGYWRWWWAVNLVLVTHALLDALTTYGTQLLWPFADAMALPLVFIIDPLYTLPLLVGCLLALWRPPSMRALTIGLGVSTLYLVWAFTAHLMVERKIQPLLEEYDLAEAPRLIQPMPFTTLLWRVTVMDDDRRLELLSGFMDGGADPGFEVFPRQPSLEAVALSLPSGRQLDWFTHGFLAYQDNDGVLEVTDVRLGVPGAHPFTFALAERNSSGDWQEIAPLQLDRPLASPENYGVLWQRISGQINVLCLSTLESAQAVAECPGALK